MTSKGTTNRAIILLRIAGISSCAAFAAFIIVVRIVGYFYPDCGPGQQDGQCGLGSFVAYSYAFVGAVGIWVIIFAILAWRWIPKR